MTSFLIAFLFFIGAYLPGLDRNGVGAFHIKSNSIHAAVSEISGNGEMHVALSASVDLDQAAAVSSMKLHQEKNNASQHNFDILISTNEQRATHVSVSEAQQNSEILGLTRRQTVILIVAVCICCPSVVTAIVALAFYIIGRVVGSTIKTGIMALDKQLLGVTVDIGHAPLVDLCGGMIHVSKLVVHNPEGYITPCLLSTGEVTIHVNMRSLIWNRMQTATIYKLDFAEVKVNFEKRGTHSNVGDVLAHIKSYQDAAKGAFVALDAMTQYIKNDAEAEAKSTENIAQPKAKKDEDSEKAKNSAAKILLHKVQLRGLAAKVAMKCCSATPGISLTIDDVVGYTDLAKEKGVLEMADVIQLLLQRLLQVLLKETMKKVAGSRCANCMCGGAALEKFEEGQAETA